MLRSSALSQDDERLDFSDATDRVESDEEVVEGTISLNGTVTPDSASHCEAHLPKSWS